MIIGIVGSRTRNSHEDEMLLWDKIFELQWKGKNKEPDFVKKIVTGDCETGGDKFARRFGNDHNTIELEVKYKLDPETGEKLERYIDDYYEFTQICYDRNEEVAKEPLEYLIALVTPNRKGGTENTIKHFKRYHKDWKEKLIIL